MGVELSIFYLLLDLNKFELEILMFFLADIHGQQIKWRASMEVKDMVGTIRLLMIFQVTLFWQHWCWWQVDIGDFIFGDNFYGCWCPTLLIQILRVYSCNRLNFKSSDTVYKGMWGPVAGPGSLKILIKISLNGNSLTIWPI